MLGLFARELQERASAIVVFIQVRSCVVEHEGQNAPKALTELQLKERSIKRLQTPDDLMGTVVFLCSSDSDFMTGQAIVVDGGSIFH